MKKIYFTTLFIMVFFVFITSNVTAQTIIPVEKHIEYIESETEIPEGAYLKDVNGLFNKYLGNWTGMYDGKTLLINIVKDTETSWGITTDRLLIRYKITDSNGNLIYNTLSLPNSSPKVIMGRYFSHSTKSYMLYYLGEQSACGQEGTVNISIFNDPNDGNKEKLSFILSPMGDLLSDECGGKEAGQILPIGKPAHLTRVN